MNEEIKRGERQMGRHRYTVEDSKENSLEEIFLSSMRTLGHERS